MESLVERHITELQGRARQADAASASLAQEHARSQEEAARDQEAQLQRLTQAHQAEQVGEFVPVMLA